jgi:hypothetical protein
VVSREVPRPAAERRSVGQHDVMSAIDRLIDYWRSADVLLQGPATPTDLQLLRLELGAPLPEDVTAFYGLANGMPDLAYDQHQMSFWSIGKILAERERRSGTDPNGPFTDLAFADFLLNSWFINLRVRDGSITIYLEGSEEEFDSLTAFAARYIEAPTSLPVL